MPKRRHLWNKAGRPARSGSRHFARPWAALALLGALGVLLALAGCTQTCLNRECDWGHLYRSNHIPLSLEETPAEALVPEIPYAGDPATVDDPERTPRFLSLREAIAMALENGTVGVQSLRNPGLVADDLLGFAGRGVVGSDAVRVLAINPAITQANIETALSRFDALWSNNLSWSRTDNPTQGFSSFSNGQGAKFNSTLAKPLPTGGTVGLTLGADYTLLDNPPGGTFAVLNPSYTTRWQFGFEQPLLRGAGVGINQVLPSYPGSSLFSGVGGRGAGEGILVARLRFDQQRAEFEKNIQFLVLNVEAAYWNLYGAYVNLYSAEQGLRQSHAAWLIGKDQSIGGIIDPAQFALLRAQYEEFRADRMRALGGVLESERTLRVLLGLSSQDGTRLVPADEPTIAPYRPNWQAALRDCLTLRPELVASRQELQAKHFNLEASKNSLLPDLRFQATYGGTGQGTRLEGARGPKAGGGFGAALFGAPSPAASGDGSMGGASSGAASSGGASSGAASSGGASSGASSTGAAPGTPRPARGELACGELACGELACSGVACGGVACGGVAS